MKLIAEIKKTSPWLGQLREEIDPVALTTEYEALGASAISVVTAKQFDGQLEWIPEVRKTTKLPILIKDFITTRDQIHTARDLGADWVLLIASQYPTALALDELCFYVSQAGMKPVVEIFDNKDGKKAMLCDTHRILVNRRSLVNGAIIPKSLEYFAKKLPEKYESIAASGLDTIEQIQEAERLEYDWALIGTPFMKSANLSETFKELWPYQLKQ